MAAKVFEKLYKLQLQELYNAQKQIADAIPELIDYCGKELKALLKKYKEQCKLNATKIEAVMKKNKLKLISDNCDVVEELLEEASEWIEETDPGTLLDAGLIAIYKKVCHAEIAFYETIISYSRILCMDKATEIFEGMIREKYAINNRLDEVCEEVAGILVK